MIIKINLYVYPNHIGDKPIVPLRYGLSFFVIFVSNYFSKMSILVFYTTIQSTKYIWYNMSLNKFPCVKTREIDFGVYNL